MVHWEWLGILAAKWCLSEEQVEQVTWMVVGRRRAQGEAQIPHPVPLAVRLRLLTASSYAWYCLLSLREHDVSRLGSYDGNDDDDDDGGDDA